MHIFYLKRPDDGIWKLPRCVTYFRVVAAKETSIPTTNTVALYKVNKTEYVREEIYEKNNFLEEEAALSRQQIQE